MNEEQKRLVDDCRMAVIIKCIQLNYIESGRWKESPDNEVLAVMAQSVFDLTDISARDMRPYFVEVSKWKAQNGRNPIVTAYDLKYASETWSDGFVSIPRQKCSQLPYLGDLSLAMLPQVQKLRQAMTMAKIEKEKTKCMTQG